MHHYPVFLSLNGKRCLVVGAGKVGIRKINTLLEACPGSILVLDLAKPSPELLDIEKNPVVSIAHRPFIESDLDHTFLVIAATTNHELNNSIATLCHEKEILCNIVDAPEVSSFIVPSCVQRGDLRLAISTCGQSPALARQLRLDLESVFGPEYEKMTSILGKLRPLVLARNTQTHENSALFRSIVESGLLSALADEDLDTAASHLREILPEELHDTIGDLLHANT